ncbi:MAG: isoprenylcysteine carboxylmethyltransferase family protein [Candidatus Lokiarchaeia archaeon]|nr:isoprenylcysteine carboxylmethyltransferase family protein [Candidatus Lokiarchaeia archaeon]
MVIIAVINFVIMLSTFVIMGYTYTLSIQPMKRSEKHGDKAWADCKKFRSIGGVAEFITIGNLILWIWFPLPVVSDWIISSNIWVGVIIGLCILIPCTYLLVRGAKDAGSETLSPSKETEMYGGIYKYIRHPQTLGEFPMFPALAFMFNSWFLVIISSLFIIIYTPIMIHYEEKDLVKRFGVKYVEYQKRTGALFPKLRKKS